MTNRLINLALVVALLTGCTAGNEKVVTESGIEVEFIKKGDGTAIKDGDIVFYNMRYQNENGSELFNTQSRGGAVPIQYSVEQWAEAGLLYEALVKCNIGDSATFGIPAKDLYETTFRGKVPDSIKSESKIVFFIGVEKSKTQAELLAEKDAELAGKSAADGKVIDEYLSGQGISAQQTPSGLRYVISQEGNGENAAPGDKVFVHYNGTLLDGTKFDSSYDRGQPFSFVLGQGQVIRGWDEGLALLNKGAKATLYIPSPLGYGERGSGQVIKPFSILKFDVELVDIQKQ